MCIFGAFSVQSLIERAVYIDLITPMADPEENDKNILQKINTIIPYLNGNDPKVLISARFGPDILGNKKRYGSTVMRNKRYLMLLYFANLTEFFRSFGHKIDGGYFFSVRDLERIAISHALTHKVKYDRSHALRHFLDYPKEQVIHIVKEVPRKKDESKTTRTDLFALSEKGAQFCENIMYHLIPDTENEKLDQKSITKIEMLSDISSPHELIKKTEIAFLSLSEYTHRSEIELIMKYRKFFGRQNELKNLHSHMENCNKIMTIVGDSGIGKTRLSLEFALQVQNQEDEINGWQVYFIHPYREFKPTSFDRRTLLILDDAARYQDLDSRDG